MKNLILYLQFFAILNCTAQSAGSSVMNGYINLTSCSQQFQDVFSVAANMGALASTKELSAGILSERRYFLEDMNMLSAFASIPLVHAGLGVQINWFGTASYNESSIHLLYGRKLSDKINAGIQVGYGMIRIPGYGNANTIQYAMGSSIRVTEKVTFGLHVQNPFTNRFGVNKDESIPSTYVTALGYDLSDQFHIAASIIKVAGQPVNLNVGLHYAFHPQFFARIGIATANGTPFGGFGIKWHHWRVDLAATFHPQLGISPQLLIVFSKGKQGNSGDEK